MLVAGCATAVQEDGGPPVKTDARHDQGVGETAVGADTGSSVDTAGGVDGAVDSASATDSNAAGDTAIADSAAPTDVAADVDDGGGFTCALDEYDVDGDPSNGSEVKESNNNHSLATAFAFGDVSECDGTSTGGYGWVSHDDVFASDDRTHGPAAESGRLGRPDYITARHVAATFCRNDPTWQLTMTGGTGTYRVNLFRHGTETELDTKCSPHEIGGAETSTEFLCNGQDDGELAVIRIEKVSGPREAVRYTLKYHN
ncbi:MAG: hypothetical protein NVS3B10_01930 [Polyangiales bacterium]